MSHYNATNKEQRAYDVRRARHLEGFLIGMVNISTFETTGGLSRDIISAIVNQDIVEVEFYAGA